MKCSDSASKAIIPGKKMPWRLYDENGQAQCDLIAMDGEVIEAGKPVTMVNLDSDAIERTITITPTGGKDVPIFAKIAMYVKLYYEANMLKM